MNPSVITTAILNKEPLENYYSDINKALRQSEHPFYLSDIRVFSSLVDLFIESNLECSEYTIVKHFSFESCFAISKKMPAIRSQLNLLAGGEITSPLLSRLGRERYNHALSILLLTHS